MQEHQITCVTKPDRYSQHEHITHIGNSIHRWVITREDAIRRIRSKQEAFYTLDPYNGKKVYIGVVEENGKTPYLRTYADGSWNNNLLSLNECSLR